ncbi:MAG: hypothetical protein FWC16_09625 [Defluviitaleaceae bacterium]|nr:hypothetical protein [Defluviitaleaceae bacterium]MCL2275172.1 hypothetical protein [Defluviitaleaceae bacterium]
MEANHVYTQKQAREAVFNRNAFTPAKEGVFEGQLVMKVYGDFCIRCYFETDNGQKLKLVAWQNRQTGRYSPRGSNIDFKSVALNSTWENRVELDKTKKLVWTDAVEMAV